MLPILGIILISYCLTHLGLPVLVKFLYRSGHLHENYLHEMLPLSTGLIFVPISFLSWVIFMGAANRTNMIALSAGGLLVVLAALTDDLWGTPGTKGFRGHLGQLRKGTMTTGTLKVIIGFTAGLLMALFGGARYLWIALFLVPLSINSINLFDLRPGRAGKIFFGLALLLFSLEPGYSGPILAPVIGALLAYLPLDLAGRVMLGDAGSNFLGFVIGAAAVVSLNFYRQLVMVTSLFLLHLFAERYSLSLLIASKPLLRSLDNLGKTAGTSKNK